MSEAMPGGGFFPMVYDELRRLAASKLASEAAGHTLDATALVHEAYLRLGSARFGDRSGFFRASALVMQRILVDHARGKRAAKRGGSGRRWSLEEVERLVIPDPDTLLDIDDAMNRLAAEDSGAADVARLRVFVGLSVEEAAETLGISRATGYREWAYARAWLTDALATLKRETPPLDPG